MSKEPKIDHEYHAGKDKLTIKVRGYALSKTACTEIIKKLIAEVERKPDRLIVAAKKKGKKGASKKLSHEQKTSKLIEVGD